MTRQTDTQDLTTYRCDACSAKGSGVTHDTLTGCPVTAPTYDETGNSPESRNVQSGLATAAEFLTDDTLSPEARYGLRCAQGALLAKAHTLAEQVASERRVSARRTYDHRGGFAGLR